MFDVRDGDHQVELDEESSKLTTFITEFGRFRFLRSPQGASPSGDGYTQRYDDKIENVPRKVKIVDDSLLHDMNIHDAFYHALNYLQICEDNNNTLKKEKFQFCKKEVEFAGFHVGWDSYSSSKDTLAAIENFPMPDKPTITDIRAWFGLVNQLCPFLLTNSLM